MDRFIDTRVIIGVTTNKGLKSNMDRFIEYPVYADTVGQYTFKIQYGQIYRKKKDYNIYNKSSLKSNMDRFIAAGC